MNVLKRFVLKGTENFSGGQTNAEVIAECEDDARQCMTDGSDSLWQTVTSCECFGEAKSDDIPRGGNYAHDYSGGGWCVRMW